MATQNPSREHAGGGHGIEMLPPNLTLNIESSQATVQQPVVGAKYVSIAVSRHKEDLSLKCQGLKRIPTLTAAPHIPNTRPT